MILSTTDELPGRTIERICGLVKGGTVRARALNRDFSAMVTNIIGGEMEEYTKLLAESREQALDRMKEEARTLGANAIVGLRFMGTEITPGAAEVMVYGTAVQVAE
ncbi:MAG: hypothetical protein ACI8X5_001620 [Planctomycetota bacterium]|jgi:uncharacterized protein YbjQ (UPF0145 family)